MLYYNPDLKENSRQLRNNMTDAEILLWSKLRRKQIKNLQFYRQRIIENYIVDFYCPKAKLVIELDGGQHFDEDNSNKDKIRDSCLGKIGLRVLRFSNRDIFTRFNDVLEEIYRNT